MKFFVLIVGLLFTSQVFASHIFHLQERKNHCEWKIYDVKKKKDSLYYKTDICPNQIVWLKDKSFYYSVKSDVFWANRWVKKPTLVTNLRSARQGHSRGSELIWGIKGKFNSLHVMVIDAKIRTQNSGRNATYQYQGKNIDPDSFSGGPTEQKAAGVIKRWIKGKKKWVIEKVKLVGRFNSQGFDEDLYNNSVLSSRQIVHYNECAEDNCSQLPSNNHWALDRFHKELQMVDNGIDSMGYLALSEDRGILFKKSLDDTLHPVKPFILCENNCDKMSEIELPNSFSDSYAMVKKGQHFLVTNENRGSVASLYDFNSTKPIVSFEGPMVFWHPF